MRSILAIALVLGSTLHICGSDEAAPPPPSGSASGTVPAIDNGPPGAFAAIHGGTIVAAGPNHVEVVPYANGQVAAFVTDADGNVPPPASVHLTVQVQGTDGQLHAVPLAWSPAELRFEGRLVGVEPAAGPVVVQLTPPGGAVVVATAPQVVLVTAPPPVVHVVGPSGQVVVNAPQPTVVVAPPPPGIIVEGQAPGVIVEAQAPGVYVAPPPPPAVIVAAPAPVVVVEGHHHHGEVFVQRPVGVVEVRGPAVGFGFGGGVVVEGHHDNGWHGGNPRGGGHGHGHGH